TVEASGLGDGADVVARVDAKNEVGWRPAWLDVGRDESVFTGYRVGPLHLYRDRLAEMEADVVARLLHGLDVAAGDRVDDIAAVEPGLGGGRIGYNLGNLSPADGPLAGNAQSE